MELKFLGKGSAFSKWTNTSATYFEDNNLLLIDCGENVFSKILALNLLNSKSEIYVFITHTHPDHVGSLGTLIFYQYFINNKKIKIVYNENYSIKKDIIELLNLMGCVKDYYEFINTNELLKIYQGFSKIEIFNVKHSLFLKSFALKFATKVGNIYFTGDTYDYDFIKSALLDNQLDKIYMEATIYQEPAHLNIDKINKFIEDNSLEKLKQKIYCMHLFDENTVRYLNKLGFQIVNEYD